tara:strand:+ start:181 stop:468 length:288 start_codon:yes stop_codon:yes gene_type:complete
MISHGAWKPAISADPQLSPGKADPQDLTLRPSAVEPPTAKSARGKIAMAEHLEETKRRPFCHKFKQQQRKNHYKNQQCDSFIFYNRKQQAAFNNQ